MPGIMVFKQQKAHFDRLSKKDAADKGCNGDQRKDHNQKRKRLDAVSSPVFHNMIS